MNKQQREEIAELILRSIHSAVDAARLDTAPRSDIHAVLVAEDNAHTAQRELWEALYRVRLDDSDQGG